MTKEHVWPRWLADYLPGRTGAANIHALLECPVKSLYSMASA